MVDVILEILNVCSICLASNDHLLMTSQSTVPLRPMVTVPFRYNHDALTNS